MPYIIALFAVINIIGFSLTGIDKHRARKKMWRVREKAFFIISALGGCPGVYIGLLSFRHKTKHRYFMYGIPAIFILQLVLLYFALKFFAW